MTDLKPRLSLWGERGRESLAETATGLTLSRKLEVGEVPDRGPHRGRASPWGAGTFLVPEEVPSEDRVSWLLDRAGPHVPTFRALGATRLKFHIDVLYWDQCNLWFPPEGLARLAGLGLALSITCHDRTAFAPPPGA